MTWEVRSDLYETMMNKMEMELEDTQSFVSEMSTTAAEEDSGIPTGDNVQSNRLEREEVRFSVFVFETLLFSHYVLLARSSCTFLQIFFSVLQV